jgi:hypothetical protein
MTLYIWKVDLVIGDLIGLFVLWGLIYLFGYRIRVERRK